MTPLDRPDPAAPPAASKDEKGVRRIDVLPTKADATEAMLAYAELLRARGDTTRFGVYVRRIEPGWGVFLLDRQYAPAAPPVPPNRRRPAPVVSNLDEQGYLKGARR